MALFARAPLLPLFDMTTRMHLNDASLCRSALRFMLGYIHADSKRHGVSVVYGSFGSSLFMG